MPHIQVTNRLTSAFTATLLLPLLGLGGCLTKDTITCNPGFVERDGACVATDAGTTDASADTADATDPPDATPDTSDGGPDAGPCGVCAGDRPLCNTTTMECVTCLTGAECTEGLATMCSDTGDCVECLGNADCDEPGRSVCATDGLMAGSCVACTVGSADDCAGIVDGERALNVCDDSAGSGVCVECNADNDESACGESVVCDVLAKTCTETPAGLSGACAPCVSDRQCLSGQVCAPTTFGGGMDAGHYCLWNLDESETSACPTVDPFGTESAEESISGLSANVCRLRLSTCAAYNHFSRPGRGSPSCEGRDTPGADADCGHPDLDDGYCIERDAASSLCTTQCTSEIDCVFGGARVQYECDDTAGLCTFDVFTPEK